MLFAALTVLIASAEASEASWRDAVDRLQKEAEAVQLRSNCKLRAASEPWIRELYRRSGEVLAEAGAYGVEGAGEGSGHLDGDAETDLDYNCTTAVEAILSTPANASELHAIRYVAGWEGTFFGRAHYYETLWRPNALARGLLKDVSACLSGSDTYSYKLDAKMWDLMVEGNLKTETLGKAYLRARQGKLPAACSKKKELALGLAGDWMGYVLPTLSCAKSADRAHAKRSLRALMEEIEDQTAESLRSKPVLTPTPFLPVRDAQGNVLLDPLRDFPAAWNGAGQVLFVAFISTTPHAAFSDNTHYVRHQGTLVYRDGDWWLRHSSADRIGEPKGMTELRFKDYLESKKWLTGINLLAPAAP